MARPHHSPNRSRDHAWLTDAINRDPVLHAAFYRLAWSDKATQKLNEMTQERVEQACLGFIATFETFSARRKHVHAKLRELQKHRDDLAAQAEETKRRGRQEHDRVWSHIYRYEYADRHKAALYAESRLNSARIEANIFGYLAREDHPLNAALLKLIEIGDNRDSDGAALATALLRHAGLKIPAIKASHVREVRRPPRRRKPRGIRLPNIG
jgi:hypothetical protein